MFFKKNKFLFYFKPISNVLLYVFQSYVIYVFQSYGCEDLLRIKKVIKINFVKKNFFPFTILQELLIGRGSICYIIWETKGKLIILIIYFNAEIYYITISDIV